MAKRPKGGIGSNQYRTRGSSQAQHKSMAQRAAAWVKDITAPPEFDTEADYKEYLEAQTKLPAIPAFLGNILAARRELDEMEARGEPAAGSPAAASPAAEAAVFSRGALAGSAADGGRAVDVQFERDDPLLVGQYAADSRAEVRMAAADNRICPVDALDRLARDKVGKVRMAAARNPNISAEGWQHSSSDPEWQVRAAAASNPNHYDDNLSQDPNYKVRMAAAYNPRCPPATLGRLAADSSVGVQRAVGGRTDSPADALIRLVRSPDPDVRKAVFANPSTPAHIRTIAALM